MTPALLFTRLHGISQRLKILSLYPYRSTSGAFNIRNQEETGRQYNWKNPEEEWIFSVGTITQDEIAKCGDQNLKNPGWAGYSIPPCSFCISFGVQYIVHSRKNESGNRVRTG